MEIHTGPITDTGSEKGRDSGKANVSSPKASRKRPSLSLCVGESDATCSQEQCTGAISRTTDSSMYAARLIVQDNKKRGEANEWGRPIEEECEIRKR